MCCRTRYEELSRNCRSPFCIYPTQDPKSRSVYFGGVYKGGKLTRRPRGDADARVAIRDRDESRQRRTARRDGDAARAERRLRLDRGESKFNGRDQTLQTGTCIEMMLAASRDTGAHQRQLLRLAPPRRRPETITTTQDRPRGAKARSPTDFYASARVQPSARSAVSRPNIRRRNRVGSGSRESIATGRGLPRNSRLESTRAPTRAGVRSRRVSEFQREFD